MTGRVLQFAPTHFEAEALLPWFVNGTLDDDDRARVEAHLSDCPSCRSEVQALRAFHTEYAADEAASDPAGAFGRLRAALGQSPIPWHQRLVRRYRSLARRPERWLPWVVVAQLAVIATIGVLFIEGDQSATPYRTLGAAGAEVRKPGSVVVVFAPGTTEVELRGIVLASHARIVDGPTKTGAYVLEIRDATPSGVVQALRAHRAVVLAESLQSGR